MRTGGWYGDRKLVLDFPEEWDLQVFWPLTPPPLSACQIATALEQPVAQQRIRELCRGKKRPLVIVNDLVRPTPASWVMPLLLREFQDAGIQPSDVTVVVGTGTHAGPTREEVEKKIGPQAAKTCRLLVHDHKGDTVNIGRTSFGTPVLVDKALTRGDFLVGIGGVYPNYSGGFGGGSKLALGVLGTRSIEHLHYKHEHPGWGISGVGTHFRQVAGRVLGADPDGILIGNGSDDVLTILTRAFVPEGGLMVSLTPSYLLYRTLAELQGARFQAVPFAPDWSTPEPWPVERADLTFLTSPNSPSGTAVGAAEVARLLVRSGWEADAGLTWFSAFASLAADLGYSEPTIAALVGHKGLTITSRYVHSADAVLLAAADAVANESAARMGDTKSAPTVVPIRA